MAGSAIPPPQFRNWILSALPEADLARIRDDLEPISLEVKQVVIEPLTPIAHVHFVEEGVVSIVGVGEKEEAVEVATVGPEGMVGVPVFLGGFMSAAQAFVQVRGSSHRMPSGLLREEIRRGSALSELLGAYTQALLTMIAQASACNRLHRVEQRCARWLLLTHDRVTGDAFDLTQLFLAQMLGVRRASVSEVAAQLQRRELIDYTRGRVTVLDRTGLEALSCNCYRLIRDEFDRLLKRQDAPAPVPVPLLSEGGETLTTAPDREPDD